MNVKLLPYETLVLRTCAANGTSHNNFRWPKQGPVKCPDWDPTPKCGGGLHGALMGEGDGILFDWNSNALWQVVKVCKDEIVDLDGKVKFPRGYVMFTGDRKTATDIIYAHGGKYVIGGTQAVGDKQTATAGDWGTATAGDFGAATVRDYSTATAGNKGTATAGYNGTAIAKDNGTATAGNGGTATAGGWGIATAGDWGTATAGYGGVATAGYLGAATAGDYGTATAGYNGTATAGYGGTVTAGYGGTVTAGANGKIRLRYYDGIRHRFAVGYIGKNGLEPNVKYKVNNRLLTIMKNKPN